MMLREMPSRLFSEWIAYFKLEADEAKEASKDPKARKLKERMEQMRRRRGG